MARLLSWLARPSFLGMLVARIRLSARLVREPLVPLVLKALPAAAVAYLVLPLDLAPDFLPVIGQLDDVALLLVALQGFLSLCPAPAVEFHKTAIAQGRPYSAMPPGGDFIDATFHREDA